MSRFELADSASRRRRLLIMMVVAAGFYFVFMSIYRYDLFFGESLTPLFLYLWIGLLIFFVVGTFIFYRIFILNAKTLEQLEVKEGVLYVVYTQKNQRGQRLNIPIKEMEYEQNDEERVIIKSAKGKFTFSSVDFATVEEYERFRMELTCEHFKEE